MIRRWLEALRSRSVRRTADAIWRTGFWCDRHWAEIELTGADPVLATRNISVGLVAMGVAPRATRRACCIFSDRTVTEVLTRFSRP